jgi:hypothetical protein
MLTVTPVAPLQFRVAGSCTTAGGTLSSVSSTFTPGATYSVQASYPNRDAYPLAYDQGTVKADGSVTWTWPCAGDQAGTYSTTLVDESDGQQIGPVYFTINPAPSAPATSQPAKGGGQGTAQLPPPSSGQSSPPPTQSNGSPASYTEQEWHTGASTFTDPNNASGMGTKIAPGQYVQVTCKLYKPVLPGPQPSRASGWHGGQDLEHLRDAGGRGGVACRGVGPLLPAQAVDGRGAGLGVDDRTG